MKKSNTPYYINCWVYMSWNKKVFGYRLSYIGGNANS